MTVEDRLLVAADLAEKAPNVKRAIRTAWSALHVPKDDDEMMGAFKAWAIFEGITPRSSSISSYLSTAVRRRSESPSDVASSLRGAARGEVR